MSWKSINGIVVSAVIILVLVGGLYCHFSKPKNAYVNHEQKGSGVET